jgi:hypothetical protein
MSNIRKGTIQEHTEVLEKIYNQRRKWLYASSIVYTGIILIIFSWDYLTEYASGTIWWCLISVGLLISVNWWYWTMKSLSDLVRSIYTEYELLSEISDDIDELKEIFKNNLKNKNT